jgi:hypothetical protein
MGGALRFRVSIKAHQVLQKARGTATKNRKLGARESYCGQAVKRFVDNAAINAAIQD